MYDIRVVDLPEQRTAVVRETVPATELKEFFDRAYRAVEAVVHRQGLRVVGPPFGMYHGLPGDVVDVEAGFPVDGSVEPVDGVGPGAQPACRAAQTVHVGPYDTLPVTYGELARWVEREGLTPSEVMWERYLSEPTGDPATWRTELVQPLRSSQA